ncbi:MAG: DegV family protein [Oscillospiraceae bacterium]|nr:DegV family protein [Oscillospiraceae bacterium]
MLHITADSPCDLPAALARKVTVVPLYLRYEEGGEIASFRDGAQITGREVAERYETRGQLARSAAPSVGDYLKTWNTLLNTGDKILHISLSSGISSAHQSAKIAAATLGKAEVFDSTQLCGGFGLVVLKACELRDMGMSIIDIIPKLEKYRSSVCTNFLVENPIFLLRGGRCSLLEAFGAKLLKIYPSLTMEKGKIIPAKQYRGDIFTARKEFLWDCLSKKNHKPKAILAHCALSDEEIVPLAEIVRPHVEELITSHAGGVTAAHCGRGTIGLFL